MPALRAALALAALLVAAPARAQLYTQSHVSQTLPCGPAPVELAGSHTTIHLIGGCRQVTVRGEHNDVYVEIVAGGVIAITGEHNDVTWRQVTRGRPPALRALAPHNDFHHAGR